MPRADTVMYAHVECVRAPEPNPADGRMMTPKLLAQCSNPECKKYLEMGSFAQTHSHDLVCPRCGGSAFGLAWWLSSDSVNPPPACGLTTPREVSV